MNKILCMAVLLLAEIANSAPAFAQPFQTDRGAIGDASESALDLERIKSTLAAEIKQLLEDTGIPSISIALLRNDDIVWSQAFGFSNAKLRVPAAPHTIYSTGSCFKSVTAMAVMQLVDAGKLKLDDRVNDYLGDDSIKEMPDVGPVTIRHLLSHFSGLRAKNETDAMNSETVPLWERRLPKSLREVASELEPVDAPGTKHRYSNYGYALAGLLVERVSGRPYEQYVVENILQPAGISVSGPFDPTAEMVEELALPYRLERNRPIAERQVRFDVYPAGDAYLSVPAFSKLLLVQLNGGTLNGVSLLSATSVEEMQKAQLGSAYGLGVGIRELDGERLALHAGGVPGYSTHFILAPGSKFGVYVASNAGGSHLPVRYVAQRAIDLLLGKEIGAGLVREVVGIGTALAVDDNTGVLRITEVISRSPASQAGLTGGLIIHEINGTVVGGKSLQECLELMAGPVGTRVRLELREPGGEAARTVELTKQKFLMPS
jgi:D-alanyl-D-alanine-carboxypeptidase/D-alanyl-D-alanine-endopeptidase